MLPVIRNRVIDQDLAGLFDIEERRIRNEPQHPRIAIQLKERTGVFFHISSHQEPIGLENHFHLGCQATQIPHCQNRQHLKARPLRSSPAAEGIRYGSFSAFQRLSFF